MKTRSYLQHPILLGALGELAALWPWLRLTEWLALGGKTTFGFGQVAVEGG